MSQANKKQQLRKMTVHREIVTDAGPRHVTVTVMTIDTTINTKKDKPNLSPFGVPQLFSVGIAVCNPADLMSQSHAKMISENRAWAAKNNRLSFVYGALPVRNMLSRDTMEQIIEEVFVAMIERFDDFVPLGSGAYRAAKGVTA